MDCKYRKGNDACSRKHGTCTSDRVVKVMGGPKEAKDAIVGNSMSSLIGFDSKALKVGGGQGKNKYSSTNSGLGNDVRYSLKNVTLSSSGSSEESQVEVESGASAQISHNSSAYGIHKSKYSASQSKGYVGSGSMPLAATTFEHGSSSRSPDKVNYKKPLKSFGSTVKSGGVISSDLSKPSGLIPVESALKGGLNGRVSKNVKANDDRDSKSIASRLIKKSIDGASASRMKNSLSGSTVVHNRSKGSSSSGTGIRKNGTPRSLSGFGTRNHNTSSGGISTSPVQLRDGQTPSSRHGHKAANHGKRLVASASVGDISTGIINSEQRLPRAESPIRSLGRQSPDFMTLKSSLHMGCNAMMSSSGDASSSAIMQSPTSARGVGGSGPYVNSDSGAPEEVTEPAMRLTQASIRHNLSPSRRSSGLYAHRSLETGSDTGIVSGTMASAGSSSNSTSSTSIDDLATATTNLSDFNSVHLYANASPCSSSSLPPEVGMPSIPSNSAESSNCIGGPHISHIPQLSSSPDYHVEREQIPAIEPLVYRPSQELQYQSFGDGYFQQIVEGLSEIFSALDHGERDDEFSYNDAVFWLGGINHYDEHRDLRLDVDNMTYEELLALEERIGNVSMGLDGDKIRKCLKQKLYIGATAGADNSLEETKCSICQDDFEEGAELGMPNCGHSYHISCIKQWLSQKNQCPVCKMPAFS